MMLALRNLAVREGVAPPEGYIKMGKSVFEEGLVQPPQEVVTRDFESFTRASLSLPDLSKPVDLNKFSRALGDVGFRKIIGG